jgi:hypothetical protein
MQGKNISHFINYLPGGLEVRIPVLAGLEFFE